MSQLAFSAFFPRYFTERHCILKKRTFRLLFQLNEGVKLNSEASILSASDSTKSFSNGTSAELLSTESSLTGISFTSSNEEFGISEKLDKASARTDNLIAISGSDSLVGPSRGLMDDLHSLSGESVKRSDSMSLSPQGPVSEGKCNDQLVHVESIERDICLEDGHDNLSNGILRTSLEFSKFSKPSEETTLHFKPNSECDNVKESDEELMKRNVCFGTCVTHKQNQIQQLQRALQDKTQSEDLLKQRLESLKSELNNAENNADYWFNQCVKKREKVKELLVSVRDMNSFKIELGQQIDIQSKIINEKDNEIKRIQKGKTETEELLEEVKRQLSKAKGEHLKMVTKRSEEKQFHPTMQQLSVQAKAGIFKQKPFTFTTFHKNRFESNKCVENENDKFDTSQKGKDDDTVRTIPFCRNRKNVVTQAKNSDLQSGVINSVIEILTKFKPVSYPSGEAIKREIKKAADFNGSTFLGSNTLKARRKNNKKAGISEWFSEVIRQTKTKLAREGSVVISTKKTSKRQTQTDNLRPENTVKNTFKKEAVKYSLGDIISSFTERIVRSVNTKHSDSHVSGFDERLFTLPTSDGKDMSQTTLATDGSTVTSDRTKPVTDVFLSNFECINFLSTDSLVPFGDMFIPWLGSEHTGIKEPVRNSDATDVASELCLTEKGVHFCKFPSATDDNNGNPETTPGKQKICTDKAAVIQKGLEKTTAEKRVDNKHLSLKGITLAEQCGSLPKETSISSGKQRPLSDGLITSINEVASFSNELTELAKLDSKTKMCISAPKDQRCSLENFSHFKLKDSKLIPSTRERVVLHNDHGFINSLNIEIKLNTKQLINELASREVFLTKRPKEQRRGISLVQDNLKQLTTVRKEPQRKSCVTSVCDARERHKSTHHSYEETTDRNIGFNCKYDAEITSHAKDITKRWINDLLKNIRCEENNDIALSKVAGKCPNRQMNTKPRNNARSTLSPNHSFDKGSLRTAKNCPGTMRNPVDVSSGHKRQQRKTERDIRITVWQEKNGCLENRSRDKYNDLTHNTIIEDGLIRKTGDTKTSKLSQYLKKNYQDDVLCVEDGKKEQFKVTDNTLCTLRFYRFELQRFALTCQL